MIKSFTRSAQFLAAFLILSTILFSCSSSKHIKYFEDIPDSGVLKPINSANYIEPKIQVDDILTILVETVDPQASMVINMSNIPVQSTGSNISLSSVTPQQTISGILVSKDGYVELPVLGKIKVIGLTTNQARDTVYKEAVKYYKNPTVIVRMSNFKITVTGEVNKPGQYIAPNEKVSIIDAIAMAGDLTIYGKRDNVLLIRDNLDGTKTSYRFNLNKSSIMSSPYYYLHQNDVVYVEPNKGKAAANDAAQARTFAIIGSLLSVLIVVATRVNVH